MIPIYIPSRSRAHTLQKSILKKLPKQLHQHTNLVVPESQWKSYANAILDSGFDTVNVIPCREEGIANTRHFIGKLANKLGHSKFVQADDDLVDWATRIDDTTYKLRQSTDEDMLEMFSWIERSLDDFVHSSISPRGNNMYRTSIGPYIGAKPLVKYDVRTLRILAYQTDPFLGVEHGRVPIMEDFDVNLQLLRKGYHNIQSYWWSQDQRQTALPGGCSDYRDHALHEAGAKRLQELHPDFVRLTKKVNKAAVTYNKDFRERTECVIQWKKAYNNVA